MSSRVLVLVVDAVNDFMDTERGVFHRAYPAADTAPVAALLPELLAMARAMRAAGADVWQVASAYRPKQFRTKALATLCTESWGRQPAVEESLAPLRITKVSCGIMSAPEAAELEALRSALSSAAWVLVAGVTTCSCIRVTVEELLQLADVSRPYRVLVAQDAVAARQSQAPNVEALYARWRATFGPECSQLPAPLALSSSTASSSESSGPSRRQLHVFGSWRQLLMALTSVPLRLLPTPTVPLLLTDLPARVLQANILRRLAAHDLRSCALTCRRLRQLVRDQ
jgi:nicotinamidase-related amidase